MGEKWGKNFFLHFSFFPKKLEHNLGIHAKIQKNISKNEDVIHFSIFEGGNVGDMGEMGEKWGVNEFEILKMRFIDLF